MLSRFRLLMLGSFMGCAMLLMPETADAQYWGRGYRYYGGYYPSYGRYYSRSYSPYYGGRYWSGYRGGYYRPAYGYSRYRYGYGRSYPRFSIRVGPFGYTRW